MSLDIVCSSKLTVFQNSRKTVRFSEQIISGDKYPIKFRGTRLKCGLHCNSLFLLKIFKVVTVVVVVFVVVVGGGGGGGGGNVIFVVVIEPVIAL